MDGQIDTIIVGGGQAGLSVSYYLNRQSWPHVVLEQAAQPADAWRSARWDSFTLVTPNWTFQLPGWDYKGDDLDGYMPKSEIVQHFDDYVDYYGLPVQTNTCVESVEKSDAQFQVKTNQGIYQAKKVVIATGAFQQIRRPPFSAGLPIEVLQLSSDQYRNPDQLPAGGILVVGSGQTGCQIAEELYQNGRQVYLCTGRTGRVPRRYRGEDIVWWLKQIGFFDRTVDQLQSPQDKYISNPQVTGKGGGHSLNLHQFARDGVVLLGHIRNAADGKIILAPDLKENLARVDKFEADLLKRIDDHITQSGLEAPDDTVEQLTDGYAAKEFLEIDLKAAGITSIIWANGFKFDYSLAKFPIFEQDGYPIQKRGITSIPGLSFIGLLWQHKFKSSLLLGIQEDAAFIASRLINPQSA